MADLTPAEFLEDIHALVTELQLSTSNIRIFLIPIFNSSATCPLGISGLVVVTRGPI